MAKNELKTVHYLIWGGVILSFPLISFLHRYQWYKELLKTEPLYELLALIIGAIIGCIFGYVFSRIANFKLW